MKILEEQFRADEKVVAVGENNLGEKNEAENKLELGEKLITKSSGREFKLKIGLEIHIALSSEHKAFSRTKKEDVSLTSLGVLGTLPQLNIEAIRATYKLAFALNSELAKEVSFERKAYFYFDLPRGYQITQFLNPIGKEGYIFLSKLQKKFRVRTVVLEEDTAASSMKEEVYSLSCVRLGLPLIEIVTEPDFVSVEEAIECIKWIRFLLIVLRLSKVEFESGQIRVDLNVSLVNEVGEIQTGRAEIKNLASYKAIEGATKEITEYFMEKIENKGEDLLSNFTFGWVEKESRLVLLREKMSGTQYLFTVEGGLPLVKLSVVELEELCGEDQREIYRVYEGIRKSRLAEREQSELISDYDLFWDCYEIFRILKNWANAFFVLKIFYSEGGNSSTIDNLKTFLSGLASRLTEGEKIEKYKFNNWKIREACKKLSSPGAWAEVILDYYLILPSISREDILKLCEETIEREAQQLFKFIRREEKLLSFLMGVIKSEFEEKVEMSEAREIVATEISSLVDKLKEIKVKQEEDEQETIEGKNQEDSDESIKDLKAVDEKDECSE